MNSSPTQPPTAEGPGSVSQSPNAAHEIAEQVPETMLAAFTEFLAPYRSAAGTLATA